jgi:transcriptional regulator with XRE-family HTH domain
LTNDDPNPLKMPREEVRIRLDRARTMFPLAQIARRMKMHAKHLSRFIKGRTPHKDGELGPERLKRLAKICLDIETGALRWNGGATKNSKTWEDIPNRAPLPVHRVIFGREGAAPRLEKGVIPANESLPTFSELFGVRQAIILPKLTQKR